MGYAKFDIVNNVLVYYNRKGKEKSVYIPYGVTGIGSFVFEADTITSVYIPETVIRIGCDCFSRCENLKQIEIPESVITVGSYCFYNCFNLEKVVIKGAKTIRAYCFSHCEELKDISLNDGLTRIKTEAFACCYLLESIEIPSTVEEIGENAFRGCGFLTHIRLPRRLQQSENFPFGCYNLKVFEFYD